MNISTNLLKLSDFPFSYSFIGGLFLLLAGTSINFNDILTSEFAPLLAIMGLLGTALAISDPFGRLLKRLGIFLTKRDLPKRRLESSEAMEHLPEEARYRIRRFTSFERLGRPLSRNEDRELRSLQLFIQRKMIDTEEELNIISKRIDDMKKEIDAGEGQEEVKMLDTVKTKENAFREFQQDKRRLEDELDGYKKIVDTLLTVKFNFDVNVIGKRSVETTWISTEIDKIVAIFYFAIILSLFTVGIFFNSTPITNSIQATLNSLALNDSSLSTPLNSTVLANSVTEALISSAQNYTSPISRDSASKLVMGLQIVFGTVAGFLIVAISFTIGTLRRRIKTVSIYMIATGRESDELKEYIEKVLKYLSDKEWEMAELWARKLEDKF